MTPAQAALQLAALNAVRVEYTDVIVPSSLRIVALFKALASSPERTAGVLAYNEVSERISAWGKEIAAGIAATKAQIPVDPPKTPSPEGTKATSIVDDAGAAWTLGSEHPTKPGLFQILRDGVHIANGHASLFIKWRGVYVLQGGLELYWKYNGIWELVGGDPTVPVTLTFPPGLDLVAGQTTDLGQFVTSSKPVAWSMEPNAVATLSADGKLTGVQAGITDAKITVDDGVA